MDPTLLLGIILAGFGGLASLAGIAGYLKASIAKSTIEALRGDVSDLTIRSDRLEKEAEEEKSARKLAEEKVATLTALVTGTQELKEIAEILRTHDGRAQNIEKIVVEIAKHTPGVDLS